jgi:prevent-host-death family protein
MINEITANDLKVNGISAIEEITDTGDEAVITVRGRQKFVVMTIEAYNRLREYELEGAILEARGDLEHGRFKTGTVEDHLARIGGV